MKKIIASIISIFASTASIADYDVGQIWEYNTRADEHGSLLYIVKKEYIENIGNVYHIYIDGLKIRNPHIEGEVQFILPHAPVDDKTMKISVTKLIKTTKDLPDISDGYGVWKEAIDAGDGGVFNIEVKQIIQYIEDVVSQ